MPCSSSSKIRLESRKKSLKKNFCSSTYSSISGSRLAASAATGAEVAAAAALFRSSCSSSKSSIGINRSSINTSRGSGSRDKI